MESKQLYPINTSRGYYDIVQPDFQGLLDVGDGHKIYCEACGYPGGKPVLVLHGGPGSGATASWRRFFNPEKYRVILFDQRGCGRSTPHAGDSIDALHANTTEHLISDMEKIRAYFHIDQWMLFGGSWGTTLALAYAISFPHRVTELVLWAVVTTRKKEIDWFTWTMGEIYPEEFDHFLSYVQPSSDDVSQYVNIPETYCKLLMSEDPKVHIPASWAWCAWEDRLASPDQKVTPNPHFENVRYRLGFTRLVTHYFGHYGFLADDFVANGLGSIEKIPAIMVRGRQDLSSPMRITWDIHRKLPLSDLYLLDQAGHWGGDPMIQVLVGATDFFAG